ncbi:MAG TPA: aminomethyl-transferring glycine dehydrogenase subunit GcvPB [Candidatus Sumerlaeota bacterium]|nr:aminomethyl-transferring glycine dehydrogenase subunit GcvPB [Candidatus Sumerlaeota bacterium]
MQLIFEKSVPGRRAVRNVASDVAEPVQIAKNLLRAKPAELPELSELDVVRHFTELSRRNFGVDNGFYPLGSCTMKYNAKVTERVSHYPGFAYLHPLMPQLPGGEMLVQGALGLLHKMDRALSEICGMSAFTMQPMAGAHGELTGAMIIAAYHRDKGNKKTTILIPDSAHGTNPASAAIAGYKIQTIPSNSQGFMDMDAFEKALTPEVAGVFLTCPNTLGLFNPNIKKIADRVHAVDGLMYYDGANLNALMGHCRPGDVGFDVMHLNLHKTFGTPHGGGGPGAGPVGVVEKLVPFLPTSVVCAHEDGSYYLDYDRPKSIGYIAPFYGNFGVIVKAYAYIIMLGREGLFRVSENAVLNANYIFRKLQPYFDYTLPADKPCKHECVFSASRQAKSGVRAVNIAKALIDRGYHPPTIYFPLIIPEAMMIEPTETESKETLDAFIEAMIEIAKIAETNPEEIIAAPVTTVVSHLDETRAAREPDLASLA